MDTDPHLKIGHFAEGSLFFSRLVERVPIDFFFFRWCQILSQPIGVDYVTLLYPISKIHSKQNFCQRSDHCDRTPCMSPASKFLGKTGSMGKISLNKFGATICFPEGLENTPLN